MATKRKSAKSKAAKASKKLAKKTAAAPTFVEPAKALVIRTCAKDGSAHGGFKWPASGPVECPDWDATPECGHGLHGLLWGEGDWSLLLRDPDALWQVVEVDFKDVVKIVEKVKFPRGVVTYTGTQAIAMTLVLCGKQAFDRAMAKASAEGRPGNISSGDSSTAASSGYCSRAASSGNYSTAASSGYYSRAASSGNYSTAASSGYYSRAEQSGASGVASAIGDRVSVKAGDRGLLIATYWDDSAKRYRAVVGNVGEDGIEANCWYVVKDGKLSKKE